MTALTDALGHVTLLAYDAKGNLLRQTFADGTAVSYTYDGLGNRTSMTDPLGNVTRYKYDAMGRLTETVLPTKARRRRPILGTGRSAAQQMPWAAAPPIPTTKTATSSP